MSTLSTSCGCGASVTISHQSGATLLLAQEKFDRDHAACRSRTPGDAEGGSASRRDDL